MLQQAARTCSTDRDTDVDQLVMLDSETSISCELEKSKCM